MYQDRRSRLPVGLIAYRTDMITSNALDMDVISLSAGVGPGIYPWI